MKHSKGIEKRGKITRQRNPIMLFAAEGDNRTEEIYFKNYSIRDGLRIIPADRIVTDPVNMMKNLLKQANDMDLSVELGDMAFCIVDTDADRDRQIKIDTACSKQTPLVKVITTTPCFEEWFLCHYRYSTRPQTNDDANKEMEKWYPGYEKKKNIFSEIQSNTQQAIANAKKLERHHLEDGKKIQSMESNPSTEVYKVVEYILNSRKK